MKLRYKILGVLVGVGAVVALLLKPDPIPQDATTLKPNENQKITTTTTRIINTKRDPTTGTNIVRTTPNYGHGTTTTIKKDGTTEVTSDQFGFSEDFGLSTDFRKVGVGVEFIYWRRLSLLGGSHFLDLKKQQPVLNLWVGIGYRLPWAKVNNLSIYTGIDTDKRAFVGLFLRMGSS